MYRPTATLDCRCRISCRNRHNRQNTLTRDLLTVSTPAHLYIISSPSFTPIDRLTEARSYDLLVAGTSAPVIYLLFGSDRRAFRRTSVYPGWATRSVNDLYPGVVPYSSKQRLFGGRAYFRGLTVWEWPNWRRSDESAVCNGTAGARLIPCKTSYRTLSSPGRRQSEPFQGIATKLRTDCRHYVSFSTQLQL